MPPVTLEDLQLNLGLLSEIVDTRLRELERLRWLNLSLVKALTRLVTQAEMTDDFDEAIGGTLHHAVKAAHAAIALAEKEPT